MAQAILEQAQCYSIILQTHVMMLSSPAFMYTSSDSTAGTSSMMIKWYSVAATSSIIMKYYSVALTSSIMMRCCSDMRMMMKCWSDIQHDKTLQWHREWWWHVTVFHWHPAKRCRVVMTSSMKTKLCGEAGTYSIKCYSIAVACSL